MLVLLLAAGTAWWYFSPGSFESARHTAQKKVGLRGAPRPPRTRKRRSR